MTFDLRPTTIAAVAHLFELHHGYGSVGRAQAYAFAVHESTGIVAAYVWQPPPPSAARSVFVELPHGVLALSRMVAVPHADRELRHVSKPLRVQMRRLIDRSRWPALVTWHDEGQGHTGHVYKCSGWQPTTRKRAETVEVDGRRVSRYSNGARVKRDDGVRGHTWIQRWEHWDLGDAVDERTAAIARFDASWERVAIPGRFWRSGSQAYRFVRRKSGARGIATK